MLRKIQSSIRNSNVSNDSTVINPTSNVPNTQTTWNVSDLCGFIPVSGPYDLITMRDILHQHGLDKGIVSAMFCNDLECYSPTCFLNKLHEEVFSFDKDKGDDALSDNSIHSMKRETFEEVRSQFPPTCIIHGKADKTIPYAVSVDFFTALRQMGLRNTVSLKLYDGWGHTDPILEAPFAGNHSFHRDVYNLVQLWTSVSTTGKNIKPFDETHPACRQICPSRLVELGRFFNPF